MLKKNRTHKELFSRLPEERWYPKKVFIRNEYYKVIFTAKIKDFGDCDPEKQVIRIKKGMSRRETFSTFIHEVLHALEFEHNIEIKHKAVHQMEKAILELILDNFLGGL